MADKCKYGTKCVRKVVPGHTYCAFHIMYKRDRYYRRCYGLTGKQVCLMVEDSNGLCHICGEKPIRRSLHVDHDHKTGKIRGLLCWSCNEGLAYFNDNPQRLHQAATYLGGAQSRI